jgi:hypothetical protein
VLPVAVFRPDGRLKDESVARHLHALGAEVVRAALQFRQDGSCDYAEVRQFTSGSLDARSGAQTPRPEGLGTGHGSTVPPPPHCLALAEPLGQIGRPPPVGGRIPGRTVDVSTLRRSTRSFDLRSDAGLASAAWSARVTNRKMLGPQHPTPPLTWAAHEPAPGLLATCPDQRKPMLMVADQGRDGVMVW